jgi:hypothetical protein
VRRTVAASWRVARMVEVVAAAREMQIPTG